MTGRELRVGPASGDVLEAEVDGDVSLYHPGTERVVVLNRTASDIWRLLDGSHTLGEVTELLAAAYDADPEVVAADVERTVAELIEAGMLPQQ